MDKKYYILSNIAQNMSGMNPESTHSINIKFLNDQDLTVSFLCFVNLTHAQEARRLKDRFDSESDTIVEQYLNKVKKEYKSVANEKVDFKRVEASDTSSFEITDSNFRNSKVTSIYRKSVHYKII